MKTKFTAARITFLDLNKIARYFERPTLREYIEATIKVLEEYPYFKQKVLNEVKQKRESKK